MNEEHFVSALKERGIELSTIHLDLFNKYYELLMEFNQKMNLTAITAKEEVYIKHFYDSLSLLFYQELPDSCTICDVGSGAGFPSIPLKIVRPDLKITIVDSLGKRILFLNHVIEKLRLHDIKAYHTRAEEFCLNNRESFSVVTARAVARLNILSELCIPLVNENGLFIAMKGSTGKEELQEAEKGIEILGARLTDLYEFSLPNGNGMRNILVFTKIHKTPNNYPRNYGQIKNKPL